MSEKPYIPEPRALKAASPVGSLPEDKDKLHATLEDRIYNIVGKELIDKEYKHAAYAEAVMQSAGDEHLIMYNYAKIRYKYLYTTASRRLKHTQDLKS